MLNNNRTATAEGQIMAQVLSTFSRLEQSRFEAFRRVTFPKDAISKYVAHCLIEEQHRPVSQGVPTAPDTKTTVGSKPIREPILSEVVAPGQAEDITIVVATLAKAYAQRLVTAAKRNATIRHNAKVKASISSTPFSSPQAPTNLFASSSAATTSPSPAVVGKGGKAFITPRKMSTSSEIGGGSSSSSSLPVPAISPEDVMKAYEERKAQGLDPGFFLQPTQSSTNILTDTVEKYEQKRLAALHAQEQYDKLHGGPPPDDDDEVMMKRRTMQETTSTTTMIIKNSKTILLLKWMFPNYVIARRTKQSQRPIEEEKEDDTMFL